MTDIMTSQNIDLSSWDTLYNPSALEYQDNHEVSTYGYRYHSFLVSLEIPE